MERCGDPVQAQVQQSRGFKKKILVSSEYFHCWFLCNSDNYCRHYIPPKFFAGEEIWEHLSHFFFFSQRSQFLSSVKKLYATLHTLTVNISMAFCFSDHTEHSISEKYWQLSEGTLISDPTRIVHVLDGLIITKLELFAWVSYKS